MPRIFFLKNLNFKVGHSSFNLGVINWKDEISIEFLTLLIVDFPNFNFRFQTLELIFLY